MKKIFDKNTHKNCSLGNKMCVLRSPKIAKTDIEPWSTRLIICLGNGTYEMCVKKYFVCAVDPFQRELTTDYVGKPHRHQFSFLAQDVGPHVVDVRCGSDIVVGGPYTCNVYDPMRVQVRDHTECADIGDEVEFSGRPRTSSTD